MRKRGSLLAVLILAGIMLSFAGVVHAQTCTDSDNGVSYYVNGQVVVSENGTSLSYNDACVYKLEETNAEFYVNLNGVLYNNKAECSGDNCYVAEGFCENNAKKWTVKTCPNGCSNGACLCPTTKCSDGTIYSQDKCKIESGVCVCPSCPAIPETCKQEGGGISWQDSESQCCGGLAKIIESSAYSSDCSAITTNANSICTNCGNTLCGLGESKCNCPRDCAGTTTPPACSSTKCDDGNVYECKIINGICSCPTCPSQTVDFYISGVEGVKKTYSPSETLNLVIKGVESDGTPATAEEGFNIQFYIDEWPLVSGQGSKGDNAYYKGGYWYGSIAIPDKLASYRLQVFLYCSRDDSICARKYGIKGAQVENTYYFSTTQVTGTCTDSDGGKNYETKGTTSGLDWGTTNNVVKTDYCITEGEKAGRLAEYFCQISNGVYQVASESFGPENGCYNCKDGVCLTCKSSKCDDGTINECKIVNNGCICSTCPQIIVKPVCGNGICESGEGDVCACPETKISCVEGKECKVPACVCSVSCPQDCKKTEGIYANLNEKFKLQVYQPVKIVDGDKHLMKITFKDLLISKCGEVKEKEIGAIETKKIEERVAVAEAGITGRAISETVASSAGGGGGGGGVATVQQPTSILKCIGAGPKALLNVEMIVNGEINKQMVLNLESGEKKQIDDLTISFLDYDYASRTGIFLVTRETFSCKKGCKCDGKGRVIECQNGTCEEGKILCPDGICREKCNIITEDCKFGCMYEGKCFPMGVRSKGLYCSTDLIMTSQNAAEKVCENNFECSSNVCVSGKCVSEGFIQKIMGWFKRMFGGG